MTQSDSYFALEGTGRANSDAGGRFVGVGSIPVVSFIPGLEFRPVLGQGLLVSFISYEPNVVVPPHAHEEEQITFVLEGEVEFTVGEEVRMLQPGMVAVIPPYVVHASRTYERPCQQVDAFHPPRRVLVEEMNRQANLGHDEVAPT